MLPSKLNPSLKSIQQLFCPGLTETPPTPNHQVLKKESDAAIWSRVALLSALSGLLLQDLS